MNMEVEETNYKFSLELLVDTNSDKVLYAEANKDFVDFLFNILSLPVATVINLLKTTAKHDDGEMVGCIGNLYKSIEALSSDYMQPNITKHSVLNPRTVCPPNLFLPNHLSAPNINTGTKQLYACSNSTSMASASAPAFIGSYSSRAFSLRDRSKSFNYVSDVSSTVCPSCNRVMSRELKFIAPKSSNAVDMGCPSSSGYVKGLVIYMVADNLEVVPMSTIYALNLVKKFHVKDIASLVEKHVQVRPNEGVKILKASLETRAVLTTVFLERGHSFHGIAPDSE